MTNFTVKDFTQVCQFISCRGYEDFKEMYNSMGFSSDSYIEEKFDLARIDFVGWWCNLDTKNMENVVEFVKNFYTK